MQRGLKKFFSINTKAGLRLRAAVRIHGAFASTPVKGDFLQKVPSAQIKCYFLIMRLDTRQIHAPFMTLKLFLYMLIMWIFHKNRVDQGTSLWITLLVMWIV